LFFTLVSISKRVLRSTSVAIWLLLHILAHSDH